MATYGYSEQHIEEMVRHMLMIRRRVCIVCAVLFTCLLAYCVAIWFFGAQTRFPDWFLPVVFALFLHPVINYIRKWKGYREKLEETLRKRKIEISGERVRFFSSPGTGRQLERSEIEHAEETLFLGGGGLYLRTSNRYRYLLIPRGIDNYETAKSELMAMGIPVASKSMPPNWEEFAGVFCFIATLVCPIFVRNHLVLLVNLVFALLVSLAMFFVISANPDHMPRMRWARFFAFFPVVVTALMFWL